MAIHFSPETTFKMVAGSQLLGFFFNWGLFGVLCVQVYMYYSSFPNDSKWRKALVYGIFLAEAAQVAMFTRDAFVNFVYEWGTSKAFSNFLMSWFAIPILGALVSMAVQSFFAWRIWVLSKSLLLPAVIIILMLLQGSAGIATGIKIKGIPFAAQKAETAVALIWMIGSPVVDVVIAVSMTVLLAKSKGGIPETNRLLDRLIRLTIETGSATALIAVVEAIFFGVLPQTLIYQLPAQNTTKIYSNSLLAVLNNRTFIRRPGTAVTLADGGSNQSNTTSSGNTNGRGRDIDLARPVRLAVFSETITRDDSVDYPLDNATADKKFHMSQTNLGPVHEV